MSNTLHEALISDLKVKGFVNLSETSFSFNPSSYLFVLQAVTTDWNFYYAGVRHGITGNKGTIVPITVDGSYFIYIDSNDGSLISSDTIWVKGDGKIPIAQLDWTAANTPKYVILDKRQSVADSLGGSIDIVPEETMESIIITENTKTVTALRALQGFIYWCGNYIFSSLTTTNKTLVGAINEIVTTINGLEIAYTINSDFVSPYSYCGKSPLGSLTSASVWTIKRITLNGDGTTTIKTATNVKWNDRLTVTYI